MWLGNRKFLKNVAVPSWRHLAVLWPSIGMTLTLLLLLKALKLQRSFGLLNEFFPFGPVSDAVLPICYFHLKKNQEISPQFHFSFTSTKTQLFTLKKLKFVVQLKNSTISAFQQSNKSVQLLRYVTWISQLLLLLLLKALQLQRSFGLLNEFFPFGPVCTCILTSPNPTIQSGFLWLLRGFLKDYVYQNRARSMQKLEMLTAASLQQS